MKFEDAVYRLYLWVTSRNVGSFDAKLFDAIDIADSMNLVRLAQAFPYHFRAWHEWITEGRTESIFIRHECEDNFFAKKS